MKNETNESYYTAKIGKTRARSFNTLAEAFWSIKNPRITSDDLQTAIKTVGFAEFQADDGKCRICEIPRF